MIRDELSRLFGHQERHRRLVARLVLAGLLSLVVFLVGTLGGVVERARAAGW